MTAAQPDPKPLIDRHGHRHSAAVLTAWSPALLRAMGVRPVDAGNDNTQRKQKESA